MSHELSIYFSKIDVHAMMEVNENGLSEIRVFFFPPLKTKCPTLYFLDFNFLSLSLSCSLPYYLSSVLCLLSTLFSSHLINFLIVKSLLGSLDTSRRQEKVIKAAAEEAAKRSLVADSTTEQRERDWMVRYQDLLDW